METIYDTIIFAMIIAKTVTAVRLYRSRNIIFLIAKHGILYFAYAISSKSSGVLFSLLLLSSVIFTSNIIWALLILLAPVSGRDDSDVVLSILIQSTLRRD